MSVVGGQALLLVRCRSPSALAEGLQVGFRGRPGGPLMHQGWVNPDALLRQRKPGKFRRSRSRAFSQICTWMQELPLSLRVASPEHAPELPPPQHLHDQRTFLPRTSGSRVHLPPARRDSAHTQGRVRGTERHSRQHGAITPLREEDDGADLAFKGHPQWSAMLL